MMRQAINSVADAISFLQTAGLEVIGTDGGWILHEVGRGEDGYELTCDSDADLFECASNELNTLLSLCRAPGAESPDAGGAA